MESRTVGLGVVVGNGFTIDLWYQLQMSGLDIWRPLSWPFTVPTQPELALLDALPAFRQAVTKLRVEYPDMYEYDLLREVVKYGGTINHDVEVETRHFLSLSYRILTLNLIQAPIEQWRWAGWLNHFKDAIVTTVSFNYDMVLESIFAKIGLPYNRNHNLTSGYGLRRVFKPHGSADFDLLGLSKERQNYPLRTHAHMNNCPLGILTGEDLLLGPTEPLIVLPYEKNPYQNFQWCSPGYAYYQELAKRFTHCAFIGLSYHPADREEIDHFLYCTQKTCHIIIANPKPHPDFVQAVEKSGRPYHIWINGPQDLP